MASSLSEVKADLQRKEDDQAGGDVQTSFSRVSPGNFSLLDILSTAELDDSMEISDDSIISAVTTASSSSSSCSSSYSMAAVTPATPAHKPSRSVASTSTGGVAAALIPAPVPPTPSYTCLVPGPIFKTPLNPPENDRMRRSCFKQNKSSMAIANTAMTIVSRATPSLSVLR